MMPEGYYFSPESFIKTNSFEKKCLGYVVLSMFQLEWSDIWAYALPKVRAKFISNKKINPEWHFPRKNNFEEFCSYDNHLNFVSWKNGSSDVFPYRWKCQKNVILGNCLYNKVVFLLWTLHLKELLFFANYQKLYKHWQKISTWHFLVLVKTLNLSFLSMISNNYTSLF